MPQQTCQEIKTTAMSIAHAPTLKNWNPNPDERAYLFTIENVPIQIKLSAGENLNWDNTTFDYKHLESILQTLGVGAAFLFEILLSLLRDKQHITIELDSLIKIMGWSARSSREREEKRRQIFRWLCVFHNLTAHGKRKGGYKDPITKELLDLTIQSKFLMLSEVHYAESNKITINQNLAREKQIDERQTPVAVTLTAGPWLARFRKNDRVLQYIGDILMLAGLPTGQAYGEWELSIGMTLNQRWREGAQSAQTGRTGDSKQPTIIYKRTFTRHQLLNMFPPIRFAVEEILNSDRPKRAQEYWNKAIKELTKRGFISYYEELNKKALPRKGWQNIWFKREQLDIRPKGISKANVIDISKTVDAKRKNTARHKNSVGKGI